MLGGGFLQDGVGPGHFQVVQVLTPVMKEV